MCTPPGSRSSASEDDDASEDDASCYSEDDEVGPFMFMVDTKRPAKLLKTGASSSSAGAGDDQDRKLLNTLP